VPLGAGGGAPLGAALSASEVCKQVRERLRAPLCAGEGVALDTSDGAPLGGSESRKRLRERGDAVSNADKGVAVSSSWRYERSVGPEEGRALDTSEVTPMSVDDMYRYVQRQMYRSVVMRFADPTS
jgi:hypothetical protein